MRGCLRAQSVVNARVSAGTGAGAGADLGAGEGEGAGTHIAGTGACAGPRVATMAVRWFRGDVWAGAGETGLAAATCVWGGCRGPACAWSSSVRSTRAVGTGRAAIAALRSVGTSRSAVTELIVSVMYTLIFSDGLMVAAQVLASVLPLMAMGPASSESTQYQVPATFLTEQACP